MKVDIFSSMPTDIPNSGEWLFIRSAVGDLDVTFIGENGSKTVTIGQGEKIEMDFEQLQVQSRLNDQEIDVRIGWGKYTPNITAVTSTQIAGISQAVTVQKIMETVSVSGNVSVSSIADPVSVSGIATPVAVSGIVTPVAVSGIADPVAVSGIADPVAVSGIADPVVVSGVGSVVDVEVTTPVEVIDMAGAAFLSVDYIVPAESYVDVPARDRSQVVFQNMSESTTRCRVSDADAVAPIGMWVIGGGDLFGESPILRTKAALRIWNTSTADALITVSEVY